MGAPHWLQLTRLINWEWAFNEAGSGSPVRGSPAESPVGRGDPPGSACLNFLKKFIGTSLESHLYYGDIHRDFPMFVE